MKKERLYYWDNLKTVLIFFVVLGHFLLPIQDKGNSILSLFYFIYMFHMPAFVFVSGYFAKYYMKKDVPQVAKLFGYLILYVVFRVLIWAEAGLMEGEFGDLDLLRVDAAPWYLLVLFFWHVFLPIFDKFKATAGIIITVILGLLVGLNYNVGIFLSFSRAVVLFPFFMAGYYFKESFVEKLTTTKVRIGGLLILIIAAVCIIMNLEFVDRYSGIVYANHAYVSLQTSDMNAILLRLGWYIVAMIMTLALMSICPKRKLAISYIGSRTLTIFILHRLIRQVFSYYNLYQYFDNSAMMLIAGCVLISLIIVFVLSERHLDKLFKVPFKIKYDRVMKKKE